MRRALGIAAAILVAATTSAQAVEPPPGAAGHVAERWPDDLGAGAVISADGSTVAIPAANGVDVHGTGRHPQVPSETPRQVAISADGQTVAVLGRAVSVWHDGPGGWTQTAAFSIGGNRAAFATQLQMSSDATEILVGDPDDSNVADHPGGRVELWTLAAGGWAQTKVFQPPAEQGFWHWSQAIALSGDGSTVAIAMPHFGTDDGFVATYRKATGWGQRTDAADDLAYPGHRTELALSADGSTLAVPFEHGGVTRVHVRTATGAWRPDATFAPGTPTAATEGYPFGSGVALTASGDTLLVGRDQFAHPTAHGGAGGIYRYVKVGTTWHWGGMLLDHDGIATGFGSWLSAAADGTAVVAQAAHQFVPAPYSTLLFQVRD